MADFVFPPGGEGVEIVAPNGVKYYWDVDNNRWGIRAIASSATEIVKIATSAPDGVEGDLWLNTSNPNNEYLSVRVAGFWVQVAPSLPHHEALVDRVALLENTSEVINEYKCSLNSSVGGSKNQEGYFTTSAANPRYASKLRLNPKDLYDNPLPIIHEGDGLELLHEENGHSHRFTVNYVTTNAPDDLTLNLKFIGGDEDDIKNNNHYLLRFHTPSTDVDLLAHLDKDQTFTGMNTFDGDVVFTGNVTMPDGDGDGDGDDAPTLDGNNTFTGHNIFAKTTLKSDDDSHRLYIKDTNGSTNLTVFPSGNISSKGNLSFTAKGNDTFANLFSSKIKVTPADGWDSSTHGEFGLYIDISNKNTWKNRFVVGGRGSREKAFEVYDDGEGVAKVHGSLRTTNKATFGGNVTANGDVEVRASLGGDSSITSTEVGKVYMITAVDLTAPTAAVTWARAGAQNLNVGSIFRCTSNENLPTGNTVQEFLGSNHLNVVGDISAGGEISGDDIEGHTFLFSGDGAVQGNISLQNVTLEGTLSVDGAIDLSNSSISNTAPVPKSWFAKVLKEFAGEYRSIYINEETNGTSDPAIQIKAGTSQNSNIMIKNNSNATQFVVNVAQRYAFGGTSSSPWIAQYDHHFTTKKYVDDAVSVGGISWGLKFTYTNTTNNMGTGKFTMQNQSGTFKLIVSETTADSVTWYDNGDMALKALDFETAGGPGPMYTVRSVDDPTKIMRQGYLKAIQYTGNTFTGIFDGASQINTGSMTVGGDYYITIGGLF